MRVYLAALGNVKREFESGRFQPEDIYVLESFYSLADWQKPLIRRFKGFLLDSGAFTFMNAAQKHGSVDWLSYADQYADFIKEYGITRYFELDIDALKDIRYVEMLRSRIEARCGVQAIPVWHKGRGKDYFLAMCRDYPYISLGGIVTKEIERTRYEQLFPWFIATAHKHGCKIHGLGYTNLDGMKRFRFDSVDSTTWTMSGRFGQLMEYSRGTIIKHNSVVGGGKNKKNHRPSGVLRPQFRRMAEISKVC